MYILDTNHCSRIIRQDSALLSLMRKLDRRMTVSTNVIVQGELIFMAEKSQQRSSNLTRIQAFLHTLNIYPIDEETAYQYGQLKAGLLSYYGPKEQSKLRRATIHDLGFGENDLWIAAATIRHNLTLVSADRAFIRMQKVNPFSLENWLT